MLVWIHVVASVLWLLLYTAQCLLIRWGNRGVHQRLGWAGLPLAIAVVVLGLIMTIEQGRRGFAMWWNPDLEVDGLGELVHPLGDLLSFSILVTAGFLWRRRIEAHKRLMLLATTGSMMAAPLAHLISYFPALQDVPPIILFPLAALYFSSAVHDWRTRGRIHPVSLWGGVLLFAFAFTRAALIGPSTAWHSFVGWLVK
jgi:hypothetical protein